MTDAQKQEALSRVAAGEGLKEVAESLGVTIPEVQVLIDALSHQRRSA